MEKICPERLISVRNMIGISTEEAAYRVGVSVSRYEKYESGDVVPPAEMVHLIALRLGTSEPYLNGDAEDPELHKAVALDGHPEKAVLLDKYIRLRPDQRRKICEIVDEMLAN